MNTVKDDGAGAIATFIGTTRDSFQGETYWVVNPGVLAMTNATPTINRKERYEVDVRSIHDFVYEEFWENCAGCPGPAFAIKIDTHHLVRLTSRRRPIIKSCNTSSIGGMPCRRGQYRYRCQLTSSAGSVQGLRVHTRRSQEKVTNLETGVVCRRRKRQE